MGRRRGAGLELRVTDEELFEKAKSLSDVERSEFLSQHATDEAQCVRVRDLLEASERQDSLLDLPSTGDIKHAPELNQSIGNYKLLQKIGEGGMGSVFMAEQFRPVKRLVAVKVVKAGMDSKQVVARFEAERQSLALMDHPNIAKVLDAGSTQSGEPYFVMELVKGIPISAYCDENRLSTKQRVELMIDICSAIQHAHQKGIIHRDLKPSNILVAQYDDRPVPKVIDFGVAKATHQKLTEKTLYTQLGQIVGTLEYMSPEQAVLNQLDVDTRTDVYSLGVILYELLVGETPLNGKELRSQGLEQILRTIREQEPPRPSLRLSSQGQAATQTAAYQQTDQNSLSRSLRGDLDWIVMKALEKDRSRRYDSASRLSEDLNNYLRGDSVEARPPTMGYRLAKAWAKRKPLILSSAAAACVLISGILLMWNRQIEMSHARGRLQQALYERILEQVMAGGKPDKRTRLLLENELPPAKSRFINAILARNEGQHDNVIAELQMALEVEPDKLALRAMKLHSLPLAGRDEEYYRDIVEIAEEVPKDYFDAIFLGGALAFYDPNKGIQIVEKAIQEYRNSQVACYSLSVLYGHRAVQNNSISDAEKAIALSGSLHTLYPEVHDYSVLTWWQKTVLLQTKSLRARADTKQLVRSLDQHYSSLDYAEQPMIQAVTAGNYCILRGDFESARRAYSTIDFDDGYVPVYQAALDLLVSGRLEPAIERLRSTRDGHSLNDDGVLAEAILLSGELNEEDKCKVTDVVARLQKAGRPAGETRGGWVMPETLLSQLSLDRARLQSNRRLTTGDYSSEWERQILAFWSSKPADEQEAKNALIQFARSSQHRLCEAYKILGWYYKSQSRLSESIQYFEKAGTSTSASQWSGAVWSRAIAAYLRTKSGNANG